MKKKKRKEKQQHTKEKRVPLFVIEYNTIIANDHGPDATRRSSH